MANSARAADRMDCDDESSGNSSVEEYRNQLHTHGGIRNKKSYGDKLVCLETDRIATFLKEKRCFCGYSCLHKLYKKGEQGHTTVYEVRAARFASKLLSKCATVRNCLQRVGMDKIFSPRVY